LRVGLSSILLYHHTNNRILRILKVYHINHIDVFCDAPYLPTLELSSISRVIKFAQGHNMSIGFKAPSFTDNLVSINPNVRSLSLRRILRLIKIASIVNAKYIVIRAGMIFYSEKMFPNITEENFKNAFSTIMEYAETYRVPILLENYPYAIDLFRNISHFTRLFSDFIESNYIGIAFNVSHLLSMSEDFSNVSIELDSKVLQFIKLIYIGCLPSPWDYPKQCPIEHTVSLLEKTLMNITPEYLVIGSTKTEILELFLANMKARGILT